MRFAISATATGFSIHTIGMILIIVGIVGLIISVIFRNSFGGFNGFGSQRKTTTSGPEGTTTTTSEERIS
jgi:hypothetical protein